MWSPFLIALGLLTRLPLPWRRRAPEPWESGRSVLFYPVVGVLLGGMLAGLAGMFAAVGLEPGVGAALLLIAWVWLTGGMHLEGLSDSADGWIGGLGDRERALAILKDPYCGPFGVMALVLLLLLKWNLLRLIGQTGAWEPLLVAPVLGRVGIVGLFLTLPYARPGGMGEVAARNVPRGPAWMVGLGGVGLALGLGGWWSVLAWAGGWWMVRRGWLSRFGGVTGDAAGAACELLEAVVLMVWLLESGGATTQS
ncbi:MAG: adenosylcobinamide-GDP ribazoletransferase [Magnetococcales bacterium]|nr:adenosylcobinamide-GDP ribazoletransferase [Magnetococcales bacterium]